MSNERRKNITFDDRDSRLQYAGFWFNGTWNASSVHQTGTLSSSNDPRANVTFNFPQPAVGFYYYGIPRSHGGFYAICIDCDSDAPRSEFEPVDALNNTDNGANPPIVLFSRVFDTPGQHVVILTNQNDTRGTPPGNSQITIDRFELEIIDDTPAVTVTSSNPESPTNSGLNSSTSSTPVGAIVGGAIGGFLAAVILLGLIFFCWLRKKRRRESRGETFHPSRTVEPYPIPFNQPKNSQITTNPPSNPATDPDGSLATSPYFSTVISSYTAPSSSAPSSSTHASSSNQSSSRRTRRERRHEVDAGPVVEDDGGDEGTLPPLYEQVFQNGRRNTVSRSLSGPQKRRSASGNNDRTTLIPLEPLSPVRREKS
ncbi:hypothetical protein L218DRAFT_1072216 [Marasmius fiardii PR-910]|nr:hypothetical protein L218DRAFT_1072216 [Marasmius fiardii PR-910]